MNIFVECPEDQVALALDEIMDDAVQVECGFILTPKPGCLSLHTILPPLYRCSWVDWSVGEESICFSGSAQVVKLVCCVGSLHTD